MQGPRWGRTIGRGGPASAPGSRPRRPLTADAHQDVFPRNTPGCPGPGPVGPRAAWPGNQVQGSFPQLRRVAGWDRGLPESSTVKLQIDFRVCSSRKPSRDLREPGQRHEVPGDPENRSRAAQAGMRCGEGHPAPRARSFRLPRNPGRGRNRRHRARRHRSDPTPWVFEVFYCTQLSGGEEQATQGSLLQAPPHIGRLTTVDCRSPAGSTRGLRRSSRSERTVGRGPQPPAGRKHWNASQPLVIAIRDDSDSVTVLSPIAKAVPATFAAG